MELRTAEERELSAVAVLEQTFAFPLSEEELHKLHKNETFRILVWKDGEEILGHCILFRVMDEAEITSVSIRKELRGQGIGTAFLMELLEYLREAGETQLMVCGLQTDFCIDATIMCGFEHGFRMMVPAYGNTTTDNAYMTGEQSYRYHNEWMWPRRYAECVPLEDALSLLRNR